jgi:hypothetical protein
VHASKLLCQQSKLPGFASNFEWGLHDGDWFVTNPMRKGQRDIVPKTIR